MQVCYQKIQIPVSQPLIELTIKVSLKDLDGKLSEYPNPKPVVYFRFDAVPDEDFYDYKVNLLDDED